MQVYYMYAAGNCSLRVQIGSGQTACRQNKKTPARWLPASL